jgi:hypothetical protein
LAEDRFDHRLDRGDLVGDAGFDDGTVVGRIDGYRSFISSSSLPWPLSTER